DATDTWMRFLVVRMLIWAEAPDVMNEMARMADLPLEELQSPMRAIVLQYAAHHMGRAEAIKAKYWKVIEGGEKISDGKKRIRTNNGRQHILYGLCAARDEKKKNTEEEFKMMNETLTAVFNFDKMDVASESFSGIDQCWAIRGASEYVSNYQPAV
ncbi:hypothetical protein PMAYCL1PPCAC_07648, partial [Pristionchus mayeri]